MRRVRHTAHCLGGQIRRSPDRFELLELEIERSLDGYTARVSESPSRKTRAVRVDLSHFDLVNPFEPMDGDGAGRSASRHARAAGSGPETLEQWGRALFKATFVGELLGVLQTSINDVRHRGRGLRVSLRFDGAPELATLPWEAMGDTTDDGLFSGQLDFLVTRSLNVDKTHGKLHPATLGKPLMLGVLSNPTGEDELSGGGEWLRIEEIFEPQTEAGLIELRRLEPPTLTALAAEIDAEPYEILHVVAHGEPSDPRQGGRLGFENLEGYPDPIRAHQLVQALISRRLPKLVVLNACYGASSSYDNAFNGVAQTLLKHGAMAVVAMRTAISDDAAFEFAEVLYRALAQGRSIESAMTEARRTLAVGEHRVEWATPVLHMACKNLTIVDPDLASQAVEARSRWRLELIGPLLCLAVILSYPWWGTSDRPRTAILCPPLPGLQDVRFVHIPDGVWDLGERQLVIENAFCIATKEVTRRDWLSVDGHLESNDDWRPEWPVTNISLAEAKLYAKRLSEREAGVVYRLPTAVEWEVAARAGAGGAFTFGDEPSGLSLHGNCRNFLEQDRFDGPAPVGSFRPNAWGLYDVHGNASEWVTDADPEQDGRFLYRGGSFAHVPDNCSLILEKWVKGERDEKTGFRLVRELAMERPAR